MFQIFIKVWARKLWFLPEKHREAYYLWAVQQMPRFLRAMATVLAMLLWLCLLWKSPALQQFSSPAHTQSILMTWSILYLPFMGITSPKAYPALSGVTAQRASHGQAASTLHATVTTQTASLLPWGQQLVIIQMTQGLEGKTYRLSGIHCRKHQSFLLLSRR